MINDVGEVYSLVSRLCEACRANGLGDVARKFDDALNVGSSGLEILGNVRTVMIEHQMTLIRFVQRSELDEATSFVDKAFGR